MKRKLQTEPASHCNAICIELCAGSARLSATLKSKGFKTVAVDHSKNRHQQHHQCISIDLADESCLEQVLGLLDEPGHPIYVHASPPCGASSRARERKIPFRLKRRGAPEPKPLRSSRRPHGLPGLKGVNRLKVNAANRIYANICKLIRLLGPNTIITIENPRRSYMWETTWLQKLIADLGLFPVTYQQCMMGGKRDKWTTLYTNHIPLNKLAIVCDRSHTHQPWGVEHTQDGWRFASAAEAEFPQLLCGRIADFIVAAAHQRDVLLLPPRPKRPKTLSAQKRAAEAGRQPRGNLLPQIIPEFLTVHDVRWLSSLPTSSFMLTAEQANEYNLPDLCKFLPLKKGESQVENWAKVGQLRTPEQFVEAALALDHPFDGDTAVNDDAKRSMFLLLTKGVDNMKAMREDLFKHYEALAVELNDREKALRDKFDAVQKELLSDKKIFLFQRMCEDAGVEDDGLVDLLVSGVKLTGRASETGLFPFEEVEQVIKESQLMKSTKWNRRKILAKPAPGSQAVKEAIWTGALEEVEKKWLDGPYTEAQLVDRLGPLFVVSHRFGLEQADKVRAIDDMSESLVNSCFGSVYKLDLPGIDGVAILARTFVEGVQSDGRVSFKLSDNSVLSGVLHPSLDLDRARSLRGRTLDLDAAYKQVLTAKSSRWCSALAIENPQGEKELFISNVLPFGASAAVYAFNRLARALHIIGERLFGLVWSNYYDDFPQLDLACGGGEAQRTAERLLDILGWRYSMKESKRKAMDFTFDVPGVTFDLSRSYRGKIVIKNKTSRVAQISKEIDEILQAESFSMAKASSLRGKLQFAESHCYGRALSANLRQLQLRACGKLPGSYIDASLSSELKRAKWFVTQDHPRLLEAGMRRNRIVIFTDASLEDGDNVAGVGMVAFVVQDSRVTGRFFFSARVPEDIMRSWQTRTKKIIATLELFAAVAACEVLGEMFPGKRTFVFVDNEAARASLIAMYSSVLLHNIFLKKLSITSLKRNLFMWRKVSPVYM